MVATNPAYQQAIRAAVRSERLRGTLALTDGTTLEFTEAEVLSGSVCLDNQCVSGEELQFGCVYLGQAALRLKTSLSRYRLYGAVLTLHYALRLPGGDWYELPLGVFTVAEAERSEVYVSLKGYDNMLALDKPFDGVALQGTPGQILGQIAERCGLALGQTEAALAALPNGGEALQIGSDEGCETFRDCVAVLAQVCAGFGAVDRAGALCLRSFATAPCAELGAAYRLSTTLADYRCGYCALVVQSDTGIYTAAAEEQETGLEMLMEDVPLLNKGLPTRNQGMVQAMFTALHGVRYVPGSVEAPGDPALECGDLITLTGLRGDDAATGDSAPLLLTHTVWRFRGKATLKAVGRNPYLSGVKNKTAVTLRQLQSQAEQNRMIFYSFINTTAADAADGGGETPLANITFVATQNTSAMFLAQLTATVQPLQSSEAVAATDADGNKLTLTVQRNAPLTLMLHCYLNGHLLEGYAPQWTLGAGVQTLALFYPFASVGESTANTFSVRMVVDGGRVTVAKGGMRATITGQGMAGGEVWSGNFNYEDVLPGMDIAAPSLRLAAMRAAPTLVRHTPLAPGAPLEAALPCLDCCAAQMLRIGGMQEEILHDSVFKTITIGVLNPPQYDPAFVVAATDGFAPRTVYTHQSTEQPVDSGRMCGVRVQTSTLDAVHSVEVS